jgi:cold shock protein
VPTGKVKFYDADKGFGFVSDDEGKDVFLPSSALPEGVTSLKSGTRVEYGVVETRKGAQALSLRVLDPTQSVAQNKRVATRKAAEEMAPIIEDIIKVLDGVSNDYRRGRFPDRKLAGNLARSLRGIAEQLDSI